MYFYMRERVAFLTIPCVYGDDLCVLCQRNKIDVQYVLLRPCLVSERKSRRFEYRYYVQRVI